MLSGLGPWTSRAGVSNNDNDEELMTISNPTRQVPLSSSAYELFAQDGDVIEGSADGDVYILYVTAGDPAPDPESAGPIMLMHESFERGHTLDGVDGYARATGRNCNLWINGTMAALP
jgi:hypothetical protein